MEEFITQQLTDSHWSVLVIVIGASLTALAKCADLVVDYAVVLSQRSGVPKVIIGATVVSLGTTAPEVAVSVLAALKGDPDLALGNAVGSIICDTGLILGLACLIRPLSIPFETANRQGWVQLGSAVLLVLFCIPWSDPLGPFRAEPVSGTFPQWGGFVFLVLLAAYLWLSVKWTSDATGSTEPAADAPTDETDDEADGGSTMGTLIKLILAVVGVVLSANVVIPAVRILAERVGVPQSVIAATMVAFGTSLPELITAINAARRGHGDLAIGNVIGADVLNALFVAGASASVTAVGLKAHPVFFKLQFPAMLIVLIVFRIGILTSKGTLTRGFGWVLLGTYGAYLALNIMFGIGGH